MKKVLYLLLLMFTFSACESELKDGDWEDMKWEKTNYQTVTTEGNITYYQVPMEGGTYVFHCRNYKGIWLSNCSFKQNGEVWQGFGCIRFEKEEDYHYYKGDWCEITADGDALTVTFAPNEGTQREASVEVTAGDIFDSFSFLQTGTDPI